MKLLPKEDMQIRSSDDGVNIIASFYEHEGYRHWEKYQVSDFPNNLASLNDLECFGVNIINIKACRGS